MKKITVSLLSLILVLSALVFPADALSYNKIIDNADLLDDAQKQRLETMAVEIWDACNTGVYFATLEDYEVLYPGETMEEAAEDFYFDEGLSWDGILLLYSQAQQEYFIFSRKWGEQFLPALEGFLETADPDDIAGTAERYLQLCTQRLTVQTSQPYVLDQADILTEKEEAKLTDLAEEATQKLNCGIYIVTMDNYHDLNPGEYLHIEKHLEKYYIREVYGVGPERSGVILLLSMNARDFALFTHGFGDSGLSDAAKDLILERFLDDFKKDHWFDGFEDYINYTQKYLQKTLNGHPYTDHSQPPEIHFVGVLACAVISLIVAFSVQRHFVNQMKSVAPQTQATGFTAKEGFKLTVNDDTYTHTTTTRVYDPPSENSSSRSSGSSHSSGGGSYGSGSSRSGKF